jgi:DNA mismatch repair protein MutS2
VEVEVRGKRMRVALSALRPIGSGPPPPPSGRRELPRPAGAGTISALAGATRELVLIGATVDDAIDRAEKFLDDALVQDARRLRVVHGHGTGRLRDAMRTFFRKHPLVAHVAPAADNEGGDGATIVELKD